MNEEIKNEITEAFNDLNISYLTLSISDENISIGVEMKEMFKSMFNLIKEFIEK